MEGRFVPAPKHTNDLKATLWRNIFAHLIWSSYAAYRLYKTICLLRGGGGGGGEGKSDFRKKYPADWFKGKKNFARDTRQKKIPTLKKKIFHGK